MHEILKKIDILTTPTAPNIKQLKQPGAAAAAAGATKGCGNLAEAIEANIASGEDAAGCGTGVDCRRRGERQGGGGG